MKTQWKGFFAGGLIGLAAFAAAAAAHEHRTVAGRYEAVVGFLKEPAFSGEMNGLDLRVTENGAPVEGLEATLRAEVALPDGSQAMPLKLRTRYKQPGQYAAYFLPARPGPYVFRIQGEIKGAALDETFESGPGRFADVEDAGALAFPRAVPGA
jgi:hypothetical protein